MRLGLPLVFLDLLGMMLSLVVKLLIGMVNESKLKISVDCLFF